MKTAALALLCVFAPGPVTNAQVTSTPDVHTLGWMAGCWAFENGIVRVEEQWMAPAGGLMLGVARTLRSGTAVEHEFLLLRAEKGVVTLTASPSGQATTSFALVTLTADEVVFANPNHDFPQRISYRRMADGGMLAHVEGVTGGKREGLDFPYRPAPCGRGAERSP